MSLYNAYFMTSFLVNDSHSQKVSFLYKMFLLCRCYLYKNIYKCTVVLFRSIVESWISTNDELLSTRWECNAKSFRHVVYSRHYKTLFWIRFLLWLLWLLQLFSFLSSKLLILKTLYNGLVTIIIIVIRLFTTCTVWHITVRVRRFRCFRKSPIFLLWHRHFYLFLCHYPYPHQHFQHLRRHRSHHYH